MKKGKLVWVEECSYNNYALMMMHVWLIYLLAFNLKQQIMGVCYFVMML